MTKRLSDKEIKKLLAIVNDGSNRAWTDKEEHFFRGVESALAELLSLRERTKKMKEMEQELESRTSGILSIQNRG